MSVVRLEPFFLEAQVASGRAGVAYLSLAFSQRYGPPSSYFVDLAGSETLSASFF